MNDTAALSNPYIVHIHSSLDQVSYTPAFWFNQTAFLSGQPCSSPVSFELWNTKTRRAEGLFVLFQRNGIGVSPCRAPFGSFECRAQVPLAALNLLFKAVDDYAIQHALPEIRITSYPFCYDPYISTLQTLCFAQNGYETTTTDLNFHIPVTEPPLEARMHLSECRRLRKCVQAGLQFLEEQTPNLPEIYQFITDCRVRRGFPVTLDYAAFQSLFIDAPNVYRIFMVKAGTEIAALTVAITVSPNILYYFLPADSAKYTTFSPTVLLLNGLYQYAATHGYSILDLGIATDKGQPNHGLIRFKQNMGGEPSLKLTFRKVFGTA